MFETTKQCKIQQGSFCFLYEDVPFDMGFITVFPGTAEISRNHWGTAPTGLCIWPRQATPSAQSHASMFSKESMSRAPKAFLGFPWQNPYLTIYIIFCCTIFSMFLGTNIMRSSGVGRWPVLLHHAGRFLGILEASHLR